jgi:hypothetical protein
LTVKKFPGHLFLESSPNKVEQIKKDIVQTEPLVFELSAFLNFARQMTLKLTMKANDFQGHLFLEGNPDVAEQNCKFIQHFMFELFIFLKS